MRPSRGCDARAGAPALAVRGLAVRGRDGRAILSVASLNVPGGTLLGVRGPSGAGKTTLLHALAGLIRPAAGAVIWGEDDLAAMGEAARDRFRRRNIGLIVQDFLLFEELSALENAAVAAA
ncbi:MAG: ATP-binding cassette domain-containing protein, partial [Rubrimonas sp.]